MNMPEILSKQWKIRPSIPKDLLLEFRAHDSWLMEKFNQWGIAAPDESLIQIFWQLLFNRGIDSFEAALHYLEDEASTIDPSLLPDIEIAVERIFQAVERQEKVVIYGDYDVDGVTATVLMVEALRQFGAAVEPYIPNRFGEGYGLNLSAVDELHAQGCGLLITVDCGIRSLIEAQHAREIGLDLIVTDHHEPGDELPNALAVVDPRRADSRYPNPNLAGVGVAYKIVQALSRQKPEKGVFADQWLDLVTVGTVADIMPLDGENRALVKGGLMAIHQSRRQGLYSLANAAQVNLSTLTARDIGFVLGPRINAAGRLGSAMDAVQLLMAETPAEAAPLAQKLDDLNRERQRITQEIQVKVQERNNLDDTYLMFDVDPEFKMGVVGLAASRLTDTFYRPSVVGAQGSETTRASCRSIPEFHITEALDECADLLVKHGGHAMAAGFTVANENLELLIARLKEIARRELQDKLLAPEILADMEVDLRNLKVDLLTLMAQLEPTGEANPEVTFVSRNIELEHPKLIGKEKNHLSFTAKSKDHLAINAVAFRQANWYDVIREDKARRFDLIYTYELNEYIVNNTVVRRTLQIHVLDIRPSESE